MSTKLSDLRVVCADCGGEGFIVVENIRTVAEHHPNCDGYTCDSTCPIPVPVPEYDREQCDPARQATPADLVAALIAEGGEIVEMKPCCTASDGRAMMSPKGDVVSGNGECAEFLLPPGSYVLFGPIPAEEETTT